MGLGRTLLGLPGDMSPQVIFREFAHATAETWHNIMSAVGPGPTSWSGLSEFWHEIFLPYAAGGAVLGGIAAVVTFYLTVPIVRRYHRRKSMAMAARINRVHGALDKARKND